MGQDGERLRLVVMGDRKVGKSAILKRFLFNTFQTKYQATIEDLFSKDFTLGECTLKVDFLDTSGDDQFPVMRRLSISSGHAFLLVYSITDPDSLLLTQMRIEEIRQQRKDFKEVPIVLVGNKVDLGSEARQVHIEDVVDWVDAEYSANKINVLECSALDTYNVNQVFRAFLVLAKIPLALEKEEERDRLKRTSSEYVKGRPISPLPGCIMPTEESRRPLSPSFTSRLSLKLPNSPKFTSRFRFSGKGSTSDSRLSSPSPLHSPLPSPLVSDQSAAGSPGIASTRFHFPTNSWTGQNNGNGTTQAAVGAGSPKSSKAKPRSRSLIRRNTWKIKQKLKEAPEEECTIS